MRLAWVRYQSGRKRDHFLAVMLGSTDTHHHLLKCQLVNAQDRTVLRSQLGKPITIDRIRQIAPHASQHALRTVRRSHLKILQQY